MNLDDATDIPSRDPAFTGLKKPDGKPVLSKKLLTDYMDRFEEAITKANEPIDVDDILDLFDVSPSTVRSHLKTYANIRDEVIERGLITGLYPRAETIISLVERKHGLVTEGNLSEFNEYCKEIVDRITKPRHQRFLMAGLERYLDPATNRLAINPDELLEFAYEEYAAFVSESGNGMMSVAGTLNEQILIKALENGGLELDKEIVKTGTNSQADLLVKDPTGTNALHCEIKSYAARERLLRGLQDIGNVRKIGVGFFQNPAEFGPKRTETLLGASPWAIYLPDATLQKIDPKSRRKKTVKDDSLYRPLSRFVSDMRHYNKNGKLPRYQYP